MRALTLLILLAGCAPRYAAVMPWDEAVKYFNHWPKVIEIEGDGGRLYYFGAAHTFDPLDPQVTQIEAAWAAFAPDIAFTEGGTGPIEKTRDEAVQKGGEPGLVRFLAMRDNVPTTTLDPTRAEQVAALSSRFTREQIKLSFLLGSASQFRTRNPRETIDAEMERILAIYAQSPGLAGAPRTVAEIEALFAKYLPGQGDYRDAPSSWFDPAKRENFLNDIARAGSDYRDRYVVDRLVAHVAAGRRVFAVMGGSHVVMQEPALRSRLERRVAKAGR